MRDSFGARAMHLHHREAMESQYEELFGSRKGEMITAAQERMDGLFSGVGGFSQFEAVSQEQLGEWVEEPGGSEDSSDMSTTASVDAEPSSLLDMMAAVKVLLEGLGEDVTRDGLLKTPLRVAQAFQGATGGHRQAAKDVVGGALFMEPGAGGANGSGGGCGGMVVVRSIELFALCEACLLPFRLRCHVAYIPVGERVVGLSKLPRVAELFAKRLQTPHRFANEVAHALTDALKPEPLGVGVLVESWHLQWPGAIESRGAGSVEESLGWVPLTVCAGTGQFEDNRGDLWNEFVALLQLEGHNVRNPRDLDVDGRSVKLNPCPFSLLDSSAMSSQNGFIAQLPSRNGCAVVGSVGNGLHKSINKGDLDGALAFMPAMVAAVDSLLRSIGEDPLRAELRLTSWRFVRWLLTSTQGSRVGLPGNVELSAGIQGLMNDSLMSLSGESPMAAELGIGELAVEMIATEVNFPFCSLCEHHLLPFVGVVHVGFVLGRGGRQHLDRSSVQKIVRGYSLRLQVQERLTRQIAEAIGGSVMVVVEASHMCMLSRGVQQVASSTATYASLGLFSSNSTARTRLLQSVSKRTRG